MYVFLWYTSAITMNVWPSAGMYVVGLAWRGGGLGIESAKGGWTWNTLMYFSLLVSDVFYIFFLFCSTGYKFQFSDFSITQYNVDFVVVVYVCVFFFVVLYFFLTRIVFFRIRPNQCEHSNCIHIPMSIFDEFPFISVSVFVCPGNKYNMIACSMYATA